MRGTGPRNSDDECAPRLRTDAPLRGQVKSVARMRKLQTLLPLVTLTAATTAELARVVLKAAQGEPVAGLELVGLAAILAAGAAWLHAAGSVRRNLEATRSALVDLGRTAARQAET